VLLWLLPRNTAGAYIVPVIRVMHTRTRVYTHPRMHSRMHARTHMHTHMHMPTLHMHTCVITLSKSRVFVVWPTNRSIVGLCRAAPRIWRGEGGVCIEGGGGVQCSKNAMRMNPPPHSSYGGTALYPTITSRLYLWVFRPRLAELDGSDSDFIFGRWHGS